MLEHKAVPLGGVDVVDEDKGIVSAIVSVTGMVDRVKDVIRPGAYTKTLKTRTPKGVWHHDMKQPVSRTLEIKELAPGDPELPSHLPNGDPWPKGAGALKVLTQFNLKSTRGRDAFEDVLFFGDEQEWSIGYRVPPGKSESKGGVRYCDEIDLFEYSPVLFGAMPAARTITSVKEAQAAWVEAKSIFGACGDGEGTCCLSCGEEVVESKADDHLHTDDPRWVVAIDDPEGKADGLPHYDEGDIAIAGTFHSEALAEAWATKFAEDSDLPYAVIPEADLEAKADASAAEMAADEDGLDEFIETFAELFTALYEAADDEEGDADEEKGIAFREHLHPRGKNGRFIAKLADAVGNARQDVADTVADAKRRRDPKTALSMGRKSYKNSRERTYTAEKALAKAQGRRPSRNVSDLAAALWGARHIPPAQRREYADSIGVDMDQTADWAGKDLGKHGKHADRISGALRDLVARTFPAAPQRQQQAAAPRPRPEPPRRNERARPRPAAYDRPAGPGADPAPPRGTRTPDIPPPPRREDAAMRVGRGAPPRSPSDSDGAAALTPDQIQEALAATRRRMADREPARLFQDRAVEEAAARAEEAELRRRRKSDDVLDELEVKEEDILDEDAAFEVFYQAFFQAAMELADEMEGKGWREEHHPRGPGGRFIKKVGKALAAGYRAVPNTYHLKENEPKARKRNAMKSYRRAHEIGTGVEGALARLQRREPSESAPRVLGALWAAHKLHPGRERTEFKQNIRNTTPETAYGRLAGREMFPADLPTETMQMVEDWANGDQGRYSRLNRIIPRAVDWLWDEPTLATLSVLPVRMPRRKDDMDDLETKRHRTGWNKDQPRDGYGRWTDTPGEAAMKASLQKMQKGAETVGDMLGRLQMDEGDPDEIARAYFSADATPNPVDPEARRVMSGNPGDQKMDALGRMEQALIDEAASDALNHQLMAGMATDGLKLSDESVADTMNLAGIIGGARNFDNPDDRLQWATNYLSGEDIAVAYDSLMDEIANSKQRGRKAESRRLMAEALQVDMISTFGQGWKERMQPIPGPSRDDRNAEQVGNMKRARRQIRVANAVGYGVLAMYVGAVAGAAAMGAKADPMTDENGDPLEPMSEGEAIDTIGLNDELALPPALDEVFHTLDLTTMTSPDRQLNPDEISFLASLVALAQEAQDEAEGTPPVDDTGTPVELDIEPLDEAGNIVESEEADAEVDPAEEEKGWGLVDWVLDWIDPEEKFEAGDEFEFKADDEEMSDEDAELADDPADIEAMIDELIQDIFGEDAEVDDEGEPDEEKRFDPSVHPRGPDGKFIAKGGAGGKIGKIMRSGSRAAAYGNKLIPGRRKLARRRYQKAQKPAWRRERLLAKVQKRKPSRQLVKMEAAMAGAAFLAPDERGDYLNEIGVNLNDMRRNIHRDFRNNGASTRIQKRVERNLDTLIDLYFRSEAGHKGPEKKADEADLELKAIDDMIAGWDADHVFDLMAKMTPEELEELIEAVEEKAAPIAEATGGRVAEPGKGNKGNIRPIIRWFERGEGAARIRWGVKGDFMRCVRIAGKHMRPDQAKGFCNKRHTAVLGHPPGKGPHVGRGKGKKGRKDDLDDLETKTCVLCTGEIGFSGHCRGCDGDWGQKGTRRFVESMVKRATDGRFTNKPGGGGGKRNGGNPTRRQQARFGGRTGGGKAVARAADEPQVAKKKKGGGKAGLAKDAAKLAARHPKAALGGAAAFGIYRRGKSKGKKQAMAEQGGGGANPNASAITGRGAADSWVNTIDALADMAGDPDSLLNGLIDRGVAKYQNGDMTLNMKMPDMGRIRATVTGKWDASKFKKVLARTRTAGELDGGDGPRELGPGRPELGPGTDERRVSFDLDADSVTVTDAGGDAEPRTFDLDDEDGFTQHMRDPGLASDRAGAREALGQEPDEGDTPPPPPAAMTDAERQEYARGLRDLSDEEIEEFADAIEKEGPTGNPGIDSENEVVLEERDRRNKPSLRDRAADAAQNAKDRAVDASIDRQKDRRRKRDAKETEKAAKERQKRDERLEKQRKQRAKEAMKDEAREQRAQDRAARSVLKDVEKRERAKEKANAKEKADQVQKMSDSDIEAALAAAQDGKGDWAGLAMILRAEQSARKKERADKARKPEDGKVAQATQKVAAKIKERRDRVAADEAEVNDLLARASRGLYEADLAEPRQRFDIAIRVAESAAKGNDPERYDGAMKEVRRARDELAAAEKEARKKLRTKDDEDDVETKDDEVELTESDLYLLQTVRATLDL